MYLNLSRWFWNFKYTHFKNYADGFGISNTTFFFKTSWKFKIGPFWQINPEPLKFSNKLLFETNSRTFGILKIIHFAVQLQNFYRFSIWTISWYSGFNPQNLQIFTITLLKVFLVLHFRTFVNLKKVAIYHGECTKCLQKNDAPIIILTTNK